MDGTDVHIKLIFTFCTINPLYQNLENRLMVDIHVTGVRRWFVDFIVFYIKGLQRMFYSRLLVNIHSQMKV